MPGVDEWWNNVSNGWNDFWSGIWKSFQDQGNRMTDYSQTTALAPHLTEESQEAYNQSAGISSNGIIRGTDLQEVLSGLGSSAKDSSSANDQFLDLFNKTGDSAWLEKYIDNLVERENTQSARDYETNMSNTAISRMMNDVKNAGYNPYLVLNGSINSASTPSVSASGTSAISGSSQSVSKKNQAYQSQAEILSRVVTTLGIVAAAVIHLVK